MTFESNAKQGALVLFGIANTVAGAVFLWRYMNPPPKPIDPHIIYAFAGWIALGTAIVIPNHFGEAAKLVTSPLISLIKAIKNGNGNSPTV